MSKAQQPKQKRKRTTKQKRAATIRYMKGMQTKTEINFARASFVRFVRENLPKDVTSRLSEKATLATQIVVEEYLRQIYYEARLLAKHSGRTTVQMGDVALATRNQCAPLHNSKRNVFDQGSNYMRQDD